MIKHEIQMRVRYAETDKMGYVYYGNYAAYFEMGRVELLRSLGISYRSLEDSGIILPVRDFSIRYIKPAYYDDLLTLETRLTELPERRIHFEYTLYNGAKDVLCRAETTLVFVNSATNRPSPPPANVLNAMKKAWR
ncbi:MAG: acyl-CoA thioesterase [Cryomorphaceae bacterium]|nr:acyl-CoA thioesterase [Flavobacteriales bacterium]